jgi:hypothetical protein
MKYELKRSVFIANISITIFNGELLTNIESNKSKNDR